jgi:hypothetical protein
MRIATIALATALFAAWPAATTEAAQVTSPTATACSLIEQALADYQHIKPGIKRKDVERYFKFDGGLQFPDTGHYVFRSCGYIKVDVEFEAAASRGDALFSPDDIVKRVSKLYLEYSVKD